MLGDANKYEAQLGEQAAKQREHHAAEMAGQKQLPIDMPQTDAISAQRVELKMTEDEKLLVSSILVGHLMLTLKTQLDRSTSEKESVDMLAAELAKHEARLLEKHRAIVAKAVAASRLPSAGSF